MRVGIVGAGPAGLTFARFFDDAEVYEREKYFAVKPCSWVVLSTDEINFKKEEILFKIKRYRIYLDNKLVHELESDEPFAYIINKRKFLERLAEGINVKFNSYAKIHNNKIISGGNEKNYDLVIDARGYQALDQSLTVPAIQYETDYHTEDDTLNAYFYSDFIGYGWVFPSESGAKIGIGGNTNFNLLFSRLEKLMHGHKLMKGIARISMSGLRDYGIGEAAGAVFPITGEGIRSSVIHARLVAEKQDIKKTYLYKIISQQMKIIESAKKSQFPGKEIVKIFVGQRRK
ncbi:NAD(P)/FAD-dependent oxidoreductase [Acidianus sulfidivorans JP7]|uniref:FAD-dependent oxidoreductase n=1 Tax=Acidianus sulfidivorans JP7 TaxID=619593 RepID=A0A2U9ILP4_9CREN|nr:NAD(P)/FAD-dependent oxidoreductase [Acidianus sulfidivorans]AWR96979.1 NAD(P)/FAD-dependent oxidoreductase [Acidianus sulfidivorans JP7]